MSLNSKREIALYELQEQFQKDKIEIDKEYAKLYARQHKHVYVSEFQRCFGINYNYSQELIMYLFMVGFVNKDNDSLVFFGGGDE